MVQDPVYNGRGNHIIIEDLSPLFEGLVGGNDRRCLLVALGDKPKEQRSRGLGEVEIPQFIDDQKIDARERIQKNGQTIRHFCCHQFVCKAFRRMKEDSLSGLCRLNAKCDGQMGFALM